LLIAIDCRSAVGEAGSAPAFAVLEDLITVLLMANAVSAAKAGEDTPEGDYNIECMRHLYWRRRSATHPARIGPAPP
jgi:hypothetical protein